MQKNDDQEWINLLGEKIANQNKTDLEMSTKKLRQAIKGYDDQLNLSPEAIELGLQKLKFRLRKEGLTSRFSNLSIDFEFKQWAVAASLFMGLGMLLQAGLDNQFSNIGQEEMIYRGVGKEVIQIVNNPRAYLDEIVSNLNDLSSNYSVKRLNDEIILEITLDEKTRSFLQSKRMEINQQEKTVIIKIQKSK